MVGRPGDDASPAEIARWLEEDFWASVANGIEEAAEDDRDEDTLNNNDE